MIPCYKEYGTSFIWYYYRYHISKTILDLDPDLCQNFLFFLTLSILHIEACIIPLRKAVFKGLISFSYTEEFWAIYGDVMTQKLKKAAVFACNYVISPHRIKSNTCIESFHEGLHFLFIHWWAMSNIRGHYDLEAWKFDDLTVPCAVWFTLSVLRDLFLKSWADQHLLTFKVNVKVKLESFNCCLQQ